MPLQPDDDLRTPGGTHPRPLTMVLLAEAFRQNCDLDFACSVVGDVVDTMAEEPATARTLLKALNLLTVRIEAHRPF
jgi:hypothetical protein